VDSAALVINYLFGNDMNGDPTDAKFTIELYDFTNKRTIPDAKIIRGSQSPYTGEKVVTIFS
jgi:hypothetical protein